MADDIPFVVMSGKDIIIDFTVKDHDEHPELSIIYIPFEHVGAFVRYVAMICSVEFERLNMPSFEGTVALIGSFPPDMAQEVANAWDSSRILTSAALAWVDAELEFGKAEARLAGDPRVESANIAPRAIGLAVPTAVAHGLLAMLHGAFDRHGAETVTTPTGRQH